MRYAVIIILSTFAIQCTSPQAHDMIQEPDAKKVPTRLEEHGDVRVDNYYWMNQREDPEVIAYLEAENHYREEIMKNTDHLDSVSLYRLRHS